MNLEFVPPEWLPEQRNLIDGVWEEVPRVGVELAEPDDGRLVALAAVSAPDAVERALSALQRDFGVHPEWADLDSRVDLLRELGKNLSERTTEIAEADSFDGGMTMSTARSFAAGLPDVVEDAVSRAQDLPWRQSLANDQRSAELYRLAWGPVVVLLPYNAPSFTAVKKAAFALAAGCPVVLKPSPQAPHSPIIVAEILHQLMQAHDLPRSLVQLVHGGGDAARQLVSDRRIGCVVFTGSREAGRAVAAAAADALVPMQLECGSNNPVIVCEDADLEATADSLVSGITTLNGQWCERPSTVLVAQTRHDALLDALCDRIGSIRIGSRRDQGTQLGPQGNYRQASGFDAAIARLESRGGVVRRPSLTARDGGYLRAPTVTTSVRPEDVYEEIFGPSLTLHSVSDDGEAVAMAHRLDAGLAAYVFSSDLDRAQRIGIRLPAGEVRINDTGLSDLHQESEQGFWHGSGIGSHGDRVLLSFFTGARIVGPGSPLVHPSQSDPRAGERR